MARALSDEKRIEQHREFGCLITEAQFGGAGCTLPYIISAEIFNRTCKRNYERRERLRCLKTLTEERSPDAYIT